MVGSTVTNGVCEHNFGESATGTKLALLASVACFAGQAALEALPGAAAAEEAQVAGTD